MSVPLGSDFIPLVVVVAFSFCMILTGVVIVQKRKVAALKVLADQLDEQIVFLFDGDGLIDSSSAGDRLLANATVTGSDWSKLFSVLGPRFPDIDQAMAELPETQTFSISSGDSAHLLTGTLSGSLLRLEQTDIAQSETPAHHDPHTMAALHDELQILREISSETHFLIWRQDIATGNIVWANQAYLDLAKQRFGDASVEVWPLPILFELDANSVGGDPSHIRQAANGQDGLPELWFDIHLNKLDSAYLITASSVDALVNAETQLKEFTQTLTKIFAELAIGLAVFDRNRRLTLFNPALTDLTGLSAEFLTRQPTLIGFLDKLRERQRIPEPKDYKSWRRKIVELESAAQDGTFAETWSLADGQTFRVTGRPHPDGALAFLLQDISAEISLTRRFRAELELSQSALDSFDDAIAIFNSAGILVLSNNAYGDLWGEDPSTSLADISIIQAQKTWMALCAPSPVWGEARDYVQQTRDRVEWTADVRLRDGRALHCLFQPISGGATLIRFQAGLEQTHEMGPILKPTG